VSSSPRVLLSSVFGPYARDDVHGSRAVNPMELYHNQVTRVQGVFSLRMFHRSWGLMLIQANIASPCTLLDFPSLERFVAELREVRYDVVGIGGILPNIDKVAHMCAVVRDIQPQATIVVGGHVANHPRATERIHADHIVRGEGVAWFRRFLGEAADAPIRHPVVLSASSTRALGLRLSSSPKQTAATLIPSVGCPLGCNFCSTSAMFGGRGRFIDFYRTGDELFEVMAALEAELGVESFFVMDENFLLHRRRALRLLERMQAAGKAWSLYIFSSANTLGHYTTEELVGLGVSWVWLGLEGRQSGYAKLRGADTQALVENLQSHGIRVLGSSIIGLPEHTEETIDDAIEYAVAHDTEFHQFMLYTPLAGTGLYAEHAQRGTLLSDEECPPADAHGQARFNFRHPHLPPGRETELLLRAFASDFESNGPSLVRVVRTLLRGWQRYKDHPDPRIRRRIRREGAELSTTYAALVWAAERWLRDSPRAAARSRELRRALGREFGWRARLAGGLLGRVLLAAMAVEQRRLARGRTYEPATFYESNRPEMFARRRAVPAPCRSVSAAEPPGKGA
jgi:hypothetical protein